MARKTTELMLVVLFLALGFCAVAVPAAYGSIASAGVTNPPAAPVVRQSAALNEAQASCNLMTASGRGVTECHVMDWNPSLDMIIPVSRVEAVAFCDQAAAAISARFKNLAGKTWKVRVFSSGLVPPTAVCRVT